MFHLKFIADKITLRMKSLQILYYMYKHLRI